MTKASDDTTRAMKLGYEIEYTALRNEILKRTELRQQLTSITLTIAAAFLSFGLNNNTVALIYPMIAFFLATAWAENDIRIQQLGKYIHERIENSIPGLGWETYRLEGRVAARLGTVPLFGLSPSGTYLFTQLIAVGFGVSKFAATPIEWTLLGIDVAAILLCIWLLTYVRRWGIL